MKEEPSSGGSPLLRVVRNFRIQFLVRGARMALGLLHTKIVASFLSRAAYGELQYVLSFFAPFGMVAVLGTSAPFTVEYLRSPQEARERVTGAYLSLRLGGACLAGALALAVAFALELDPLRRLLLVGLALGAIADSLRSAEDVLAAEERFGARGALHLILSVTTVAALWWQLAAGAGPVGVVVAGLVANVVVLVLTWGVIRRDLALRLRWDGALAKLLLGRGSAFVAAGLAQVFLARLDVLMLEYFHGVAVVGTYAAAQRLVELGLVPLGVMLGTMLPAVTRLGDDAEARRGLFAALWRLALALQVGVCLTLVLAAEPLLAVIFGPDYLVAEGCLRVMALRLLPMGLGGLAQQALVMTRRDRELAYTAGVALVVNAAMNLLWIPTHRASGAAAATVLAMVVLAGLLTWRTREITGLAGARLVPAGAGKLVVAAAALAGTLAASAGWPLLLRLSLAWVAYLGLLLGTGFVRPGEARAFVGRRGPE